MLDTAGKVLEKLIRPRLLTAVKAGGDLSNKQFGFRSGKSTADVVSVLRETFRMEQEKNQHSKEVILLATIDVKNAFNSASWKNMVKPLRDKYKVPPYILRMGKNYLNDRQLLYETKNGLRAKKVSAGTAQGSILGPEFWNISYDDILTLELSDGCYLIGYADDIAIVITGRNTKEIQEKLSSVIRILRRWLDDHGLALAAEKTDLIFLTKKQKANFNNIQAMHIEDHVIERKEFIKYLGFALDSKMSFGEHIRKGADKASAVTNRLVD